MFKLLSSPRITLVTLHVFILTITTEGESSYREKGKEETERKVNRDRIGHRKGWRKMRNRERDRATARDRKRGRRKR